MDCTDICIRNWYIDIVLLYCIPMWIYWINVSESWILWDDPLTPIHFCVPSLIFVPLMAKYLAKNYWLSSVFSWRIPTCVAHDCKIEIFIGYFWMRWVVIRAGVYCPHLWAQLVFQVKAIKFGMNVDFFIIIIIIIIIIVVIINNNIIIIIISSPSSSL